MARIRFWSVHLSAPTDSGRFWFKENCPEQLFEARLVAALAGCAAERVLRVAAVDPDRGWILSPDQSPVLRDAGPVSAAGWQRLLVDYALLQREVTAQHLDLPGLGLTVLTPADAPAHLDRRLNELSRLPADDPGRLADADAARLRSLVPTVARWAETVTDLGLPLTLEHSDLHTGNAFATPVRTPLRVFDFGDAVCSSPLLSLLVPIRAMTVDDAADRLTPAEVDRVVDAYLEVFSDLVPLPALRAAVPAAVELGKLNRQESWRRTLLSADAAGYAELGDAPAAWLAMLGR